MSAGESSLTPPLSIQCQTIKNWQRWLVRLLGRAPTLLIAEDEDETLTGLIAWFEYAGFDVRGVRDGSELLVLLEPILQGEEGIWWEPDAILTDLRMPGVEPFNVVEGLRYMGVGTPIVVVSAFGDSNIHRRVDAMDCADFVAKPFDILALYKTVCRAIYRGRRQLSTAPAADLSPVP